MDTITAIAMIVTTFKMVKTNWKFPDFRTPTYFNAVSNVMMTSASN